ncbi:MAG: radical SAM protein [Nitrospira sp.]|nr:radical SAM protein [Nitrospira sp.]
MFKTVKNYIGEFIDRYFIDTRLRVHKITTSLLGPRYTSKRDLFIEIDITYRCNLKCLNCNRSCTQAPSNKNMSIEQIRKFVKESAERDIKWKRIRLLGGEPTLHSDLPEILNILMEYKKSFSPATSIYLLTNGCGQGVNSILSALPNEIIIQNSQKTGIPEAFIPFNLAPCDDENYNNSDFTNACYTVICFMKLMQYITLVLEEILLKTGITHMARTLIWVYFSLRDSQRHQGSCISSLTTCRYAPN